jgi:hypothetical protein
LGPGHQIFAGRLSQRRKRERRKGFEPSTPSLGSSFSKDPRTSRDVRERSESFASEGLERPASPSDRSQSLAATAGDQRNRHKSNTNQALVPWKPLEDRGFCSRASGLRLRRENWSQSLDLIDEFLWFLRRLLSVHLYVEYGGAG